MSLPIIVGCECSGRTRGALRELGFEAWSCDIKPAEDGSPYHIQDDLLAVLRSRVSPTRRRWGLGIFHPDCTFLANSGAKHLFLGMRKENGRCPDRWAKMEDGAAFYREVREAPIERKVIENPVMHGHAIERTGRGHTQFVHPYFFGDPFFKFTGFELINVPPLQATNRLTPPRPGTDEHKAWSAVHREPPGPNRRRNRSVTFPGIAAALASQYGPLA